MEFQKGALFFPASGVIGETWPYTSKYLPKTWRGFIFGPYAHFLIMKFFSKNLKFFFDFLKIQRGDPVDFKKSKKNFKFFEKNFINKKCAYGPKMKPRQGFRQIFWSIWSGGPNNPRGGEKKGSFFQIFSLLVSALRTPLYIPNHDICWFQGRVFPLVVVIVF